MRCPYCERDKDKVTDSRPSDSGDAIRRRRECIACGKRFTTYERVERTERLMVVKRDGSRVPFNGDNVMRGIVAACGKRPISADTKAELVRTLEDEGVLSMNWGLVIDAVEGGREFQMQIVRSR